MLSYAKLADTESLLDFSLPSSITWCGSAFLRVVALSIHPVLIRAVLQSHELRSPLFAILGLAAVLESSSDELSNTSKEHIAQIILSGSFPSPSLCIWHLD
jgi:hypothetical protein